MDNMDKLSTFKSVLEIFHAENMILMDEDISKGYKAITAKLDEPERKELNKILLLSVYTGLDATNPGINNK